jgi:hypothetical protein
MGATWFLQGLQLEAMDGIGLGHNYHEDERDTPVPWLHS